MKRTSRFRDHLMSPESHNKRQKLKILLEELAKPEIDVPVLSQYSSMIMTKLQTQNMMIIPQLVKHILNQNEPLVLEIIKNKRAKTRFDEGKDVAKTKDSSRTAEESFPEEVQSQMPVVEASSETESTSKVETEALERNTGENQFEIIFSDSTRPTDNDTHIIHSTTERTASTVETTGTVNVPNSFPLFQIVHTGEVPEDVQDEIVRLIRQANPELDLNSITFKFKSPETVEIIANVNS